MTQTPLRSDVRHLPADRDLTLCPFGCEGAAQHNDSCYSWECGSNSLRLASDSTTHDGKKGDPIPGDLVQTPLCRLRLEMVELRRERDELQRKPRMADYRGCTYLRPLWWSWPSWCYRLWRRFGCRREMHLFDEVYSTGGGLRHYLVCDACQLMVGITCFDDTYCKDAKSSLTKEDP